MTLFQKQKQLSDGMSEISKNFDQKSMDSPWFMFPLSHSPGFHGHGNPTCTTPPAGCGARQNQRLPNPPGPWIKKRKRDGFSLGFFLDRKPHMEMVEMGEMVAFFTEKNWVSGGFFGGVHNRRSLSSLISTFFWWHWKKALGPSVCQTANFFGA